MKTLANGEDLEEIRGRVGQLTEADVRLWGGMNCHQMVCHLTDAFGCSLGERAVAALKGPPIPVGVYRWLALWVPMKWPKGVKTTPEMDQRIGGTRPGEFVADLGQRDPDARLNLLLTDGQRVLATRWNDTLSVLATDDGVVVASEPYDDDPRWTDLPEHHLVEATAGVVAITELEA